jgi:bacterioferritin-associated ferredoxin
MRRAKQREPAPLRQLQDKVGGVTPASLSLDRAARCRDAGITREAHHHVAVDVLAIRKTTKEPQRSVFMIVCSCNILSDHDVRDAVRASEYLPRNAKQVFGCLGCSAECGRCARTIKTIIDQALGLCASTSVP